MNNKVEGQGKFQFADGDIYDGHWVNDKANGYGTFFSKDGAKYVGEWKEDV